MTEVSVNRSGVPVPAAALVGCVALCLVLSILAQWLPLLGILWWILVVSVAMLAVADLAVAILRARAVSATRHLSRIWPVGVSADVRIELGAAKAAFSTLPLGGILIDHVPAGFELTDPPVSFSLPMPGRVDLDYRARSPRRGLHAFGPIELLLWSPVRLWRLRWRVWPESGISEIRVFPDFARVAHYTLLATDHRLAQMGVIQRRRRGEGMEFHQLREYREGDSPRQIDWKATSRQRRLISREYQEERDQQIMFMLDCGMRMRTLDHRAGDGAAPLSHFDEALNALLLLSYVALRQGDAVGLLTFAAESTRHLAPRASHSTLQLLMDATYDLEPSLAVPDFLKAAEEMSLKVRKRSLIVILTNLRDEDEATLLASIRVLSRRHRVVLASLVEPGLDALRRARVVDFDDALAYAAATDYRLARHDMIARLRKSGALCLDVAARQLAITLVNQYWSLKRSGAF